MTGEPAPVQVTSAANPVTRERHLVAAFVELADTLVAEFDAVEFLSALADRCVDLLDASAAGLLLSDQRGKLVLMASSSEQARLLELFQLQTDEGPCLDCYRSGQPVVNADLQVADSRWPRFAERARDSGFHSMHALPMRLREEVIGALNLFRADPGLLTDADVRLGQALADVATIGLLQERAIQQQHILSEQLQTALNSRILIEQAKGVLAERGQLDMERAFQLLRAHARGHRRRLSDVARDVIDGSLDVATLMSTTGDEVPRRVSG